MLKLEDELVNDEKGTLIFVNNALLGTQLESKTVFLNQKQADMSIRQFFIQGGLLLFINVVETMT